MARRLLAKEVLTVTPKTPQQEEEKILATFLDVEGRLRKFPTAHKKKLVILKHILPNFEPGQGYREPEVNDIMRRYHDDVASLRRAMIDFGFMARASGLYWRIEGEGEGQR